MSPKRRNSVAAYTVWRKEFLQTVGHCEICGASPHCVHHIARGIHRENAQCEPCAVLALCIHCHEEEVHGAGQWPIPRQLAALACSRPMDLNLPQFNILRGRDVNALGFLDILPFLEMRYL